MQVLARVLVAGRGYEHPDGRVAASSLMLQRVLEYVPCGPDADERVLQLDYAAATATVAAG